MTVINRYLLFVSWPLILSILKAFIQKKESIALPKKGFDSVSLSSTEEKKTVLERIQIEFLLYYSSKTIYSSAQICISAGNIYAVKAGGIVKHQLSPSVLLIENLYLHFLIALQRLLQSELSNLDQRMSLMNWIYQVLSTEPGQALNGALYQPGIHWQPIWDVSASNRTVFH